MLKKTRNHFSLSVAVCAVLYMPVGQAQPGSPQGGGPGGMPPGGGPGAPGGNPDGMMAGGGGMMMAPGGHDTAAIYISKGARQADHEFGDDTVAVSVAKGAKGVSGTQADGLLLRSTAYNATGLVVADGSYQFGGDKDYYTVYSDISADYLGTSLDSGPDRLGKFNSVLLFTLNSHVAEDAKTGSSGVDAANEAVVHIDNVYMQVDGRQRYVDSSLNNSTTIINDSYFVSTGDAASYTDDISVPFSNEALLIDGGARTNFSIGESDAYYFNSTVIAEGWATLSTDACGGLNLIAYNTTAKALNGGYATYADFNCHVQLFGSTLEAAEIGAIISKSGRVTALDGASAGADILAMNKGAKTSKGTVLTGGRNAVMIHAPDMMGSGLGAVDYGFFTAKNSTLATSKKLHGTFDYSTYGDEVQKYVDYISGDVILVKSTSANIELDHVEMDSYNGVLVHSVLNSDRMGNFLAAGDNTNPKVKPISLSMVNMKVTGNILHDDYQRNMEVSLADVDLTGAIRQGSYTSWKAYWESQGANEANWLPNNSWSGSNSLALSLDARTNWTVTDTSAVAKLTIATGAKIKGAKGAKLKMTVNGKETAIAPGTYEGDIVITPGRS